MDQEILAHFKKKLEDMHESLLSEADKTISEMTDHSDNYPDPTDRASAESDRNFELRIRDRERKLLSKIKSALDRIEDSSYGICDGCGEDIATERLNARPVTTYCIECKTSQEQNEKGKA
ncbi:MAG: RNA polymerase-binding protein DksA [Proteobacteria bacterium]|nr:RNA polymerase-binding protein DksA [Pseudomonadota bacterium]MBU1716995.1 RNA polymerase-binding protein DksA [Pseudomonadota bacterium]